VHGSKRQTSMALAIVVTAVALGAVNFGLAVLIVAAIGVRSIAPPELGAASLAVGVAAAAWAVLQWRAYLRARRDF